MATTATFVVNFGGVDNAFLSVALDEIKNNNKTTFQKGDPVHFKIYSNCNYVIEKTSGTISDGLKNVKEDIKDFICSFIKGAPASTDKKIVNILNQTFYPTSAVNTLGTIDIVDITNVQIQNATTDTLGIAKIDYQSEYDEYTLIPPGDMTDVYYILIYIEAII